MTVNWGVRYDRQHPYVPAQGNEPNRSFPTLFPGGNFPKVDNIGLFNDVVPRVGLSWDTAGNGRTVVKATYSIYTDRLANGYSLDWNVNQGQTATFRFKDLNGNRDYDAGEVDLTVSDPAKGIVGRDYISSTIISTPPPVNHDLKMGYTREVTASVERELAHNLAFRGQFVYKALGDVQASYNPSRPYEVWDQKFVRRDPGPDGLVKTADDPLVNGAPRMVTFYDYNPAYAALHSITPRP